MSTSPSFQPNKITFDMRVVWPRKQGRGRGGILTFQNFLFKSSNFKKYPFFNEFLIFSGRFSSTVGHFSEHWWPAAGSHGLAQSSEEQRRLLCQEGEGSTTRPDGGAAQLDVLRGHPSQPSRYFISLTPLTPLSSHFCFCLQISSVGSWRRSTIPPSAATTT